MKLKSSFIFKVKRKDLENVEIDDETLMALLELPPEAFEIYRDRETGIERIRIKSSYRREIEKKVRSE